MRRTIMMTAAGLALLAGSLSARADVDTEVPAPAKLQGSLGDAEVETIRFFAPEGSTLSAKLSTKKKAGMDVVLRLLDPDGVEQTVPSVNVTDKGASIKLKKLEIGRTGTWALQVSADRPGDYKLTIKTKLPKKLSFDVNLAGAAVPVTIPVSFGSTLKMTVKATRGSAAVPELSTFDGADISQEGKRKGGSHKATVVAGAAGDLVLEVAPDGADGAVDVTVVIKPPKSKTAKVDVRGATLGRPEGGETAVGKVVLPAEGARIEVASGTDLDGAAIDVPAGALTEPTLISIRSATPEALTDPAADTGAGPTVEFLPSGLQFAQPVTVTVPIDATSLPVQATEDDITVLIVEDDGSSREVVPTTVDLDAGVCTVPTSSFSRFTAVAPVGSPQLAGRKYWGFAFDMSLEMELSGRNESGERRLSRTDILFEFDPDGVTVNAEFVERELRFGNVRGQNEQLEGVFLTDTAATSESATWQYGPGGQHIELLVTGGQEDEHLFVSRDGTVLLNAVSEVSEGLSSDAQLDVLLERPRTLDPSALIVGTYYIGDLSIGLDQMQPNDFVQFELLSTFGTVTFKPNGVFSFDVTHVLADGFPRDSPPAFEFNEERDRGSGTWSIEQSGPFAGAVLIGVDGEQMRVLPDRFGRTIVAMQMGDEFDDWTYLVGVKTSSGRTLSELNGEYAGGTLFVDAREYDIEDGQPGSGQFLTFPDFSLSGSSDRLLFDGTSTATLQPQASVFQERNTQVAGGVFFDRMLPSQPPFGVSLRKDGRFEIIVDNDELRGAVTVGGEFAFVVPDPDQQQFGLVFFANRPPRETPQQ